MIDSCTPSALADRDLTQRLTALARSDRAALLVFLRHLAEFDARRLFLGLGYSNIHVYCVDALKLSDGTAYRRYTVARLLKRFPVIAAFIEDGRLTLTRIATLREVLTDDNHRELLERAMLGAERDVKLLAASLRPKGDVTDCIRKVVSRTVTSTLEVPPTDSVAETPAMAPRPPPVQRQAVPSLAGDVDGLFTSRSGSNAVQPTVTSTVEVRGRPAERMRLEATSAEAFALRMRVSPEFLAEFEEVKAALSHKIPDGNFEAIMRECFRLTLDHYEKRRSGSPRRCRRTTQSATSAFDAAPTTTETSAASVEEHPAAPLAPVTEPAQDLSSPSRNIPAAVRRAVWERDGGRCAFVSADGKRCDARYQVQFHHLHSFATGGPSTEENLSLRCRHHNYYEAELAFGADFMKCRASARPPAVPAADSLPLWKCGQPVDRERVGPAC